MKIVILCGGLGTRLAEETKIKPKPMVKIGRYPILIHLINYYKSFGYKEFILALGFKSSYIKNFFKQNKIKGVKIHLVDTGKSSLTGGRLLRLKKCFTVDENFMLTYGDGLSNVNLKKLSSFHKNHKKIATVTAVRPAARFGELNIDGKPQTSQNWINGGFFILNYKIFKFLKDDKTILEREPLQKLSKQKQLMAFKHYGFWQCMDTLRDKLLLNKIWRTKKAPWIGKN